MKLRRVVLPLVALLLATSPHSSAAEAPIEPGTIVNSWALAPAGSDDPDAPGERPFLSYEAAPGSEIKDSVVLYNYSNVALVFRLLTADAFNNADGQFDVPPSSAIPKDVGTWITLPQENLALPANTSARVDITIRVPRNATPGDHAGAILASSPTQGTGRDGKIVNVDRRTGSRVYIRVAGRLTPELAIASVETTYRPSLNPFSGRTDVRYRIENQGNVRMTGRHRVQVSALFGLGKRSNKSVDLPELLPGESVELAASFKGLPATFLNFATVKLDPADFDGKTLAVMSRSSRTVSVPWSVFAMAAMVVLLRYAWRAYQRHALGAEAGAAQPA